MLEYLIETRDEYKEAIFHDLENPSLKRLDLDKHYVDIVRVLNYIIKAWEIVGSKNIDDPTILEHITLFDIHLPKVNGIYYHLDVLKAQNIKNYIFDVANVAILIY